MRPEQETRQLSPVQMWAGEEETQPLPPVAGQVFLAFLAWHDLSILDVGLEAGVRLLTIWNIGHDHPISLRHAEMVRAGLYRLTGVRYRARIALCQEHVGSGALERAKLDRPPREPWKARYH